VGHTYPGRSLIVPAKDTGVLNKTPPLESKSLRVNG
jgi:hypothetical protein